MKTVYAIIVTYNGMQWIDRCIESLINSEFPVSIIVIDNVSADETFAHISKNYPAVKLIQAEKNLGFGQGNNIGLKLAVEQNADYILLLNQDAWIKNNTIANLVDIHEQHPEYGIISPLHLNGAGSNFDDHFLEYLKRSDIKDLLWHNLVTQSFDSNIINTAFVNAAAWCISSACLRKVGGFDPIFFHYGEDDNYGQRTIYKGFKMGILPTAIIYHDKVRPALNINPGKKSLVKKDWVQFLVYACNINEKKYKILIFKRLARHIIQLLYSLFTFNGDSIGYHFAMAKNIVTSFNKIQKSRSISVNGINGGIPHL